MSLKNNLWCKKRILVWCINQFLAFCLSVGDWAQKIRQYPASKWLGLDSVWTPDTCGLPKRRRSNCSYLRERFSERYAACKSKMVSTGEGTTTNSIESLTARMPLMSWRQVDCGTLVTWSEDPKTYQGRPKSRWADGANSDSLALWVRDCTHCAQGRQSWKNLLGHALTKYWLYLQANSNLLSWLSWKRKNEKLLRERE
jgi:hypothetical protein